MRRYFAKKNVCTFFLILFASLLFDLKGYGEEEAKIEKPTYIYDKSGRIVIYHGITVSNSARKTEDFLPWQSKDDFSKLKNWGFNLVRYLIFWEAIEPTSGIYNEAYMQSTLERLQWLDELGIDVLLCVHQDLFSRKFGGSGFPSWAIHDKDLPFTPVTPPYKNYFSKPVMTCFDYFWRSEMLKKTYIDMLKYVLSKVDKQPNLIGIEVFDEPWPHIGPGFEQTFLTEFYQRIDKMMQENNFQTRIFFQPMLISSVLIPTGLQFKPTVPSIYAVRYFDPLYDNQDETYGRTNNWIMSTTISQRVREAKRWGIPMMITDFGVNLNMSGASQFLDDWFKLVDQYHLGWVYNSYDKDTDNPYAILDGEGNAKPILSKLIQTYPQRIAGKNPSWFVRGNLFKLTYENIGINSPTVVFIPKSDVARQVVVNGKFQPYDPLRNLCFEYVASQDEKTINIVVQW
ncbi:MAG TPA: cellulase family glycosylhydrolase [Candidatus Hydrogenedens sp.]|nr:cellulase family glycosylhydrolase [Candidatus Hydrogenedens sp.]HOL19847.1 cellulase family glycosylhydrolase [Candidatus Hydrogenedens sp.]HPP59570.1 cellulase family glycosylhydrolase [Candidatus Hydrogenedens sp.]